MMRSLRRCVAVGALLAAVWIVPAAGAATPQRFTLDFQHSDTIDCSEFNPSWTFDDNFTDFYHLDVTVFSDANGNPIGAATHVQHVSNDVNSASGFTLHEHNNYVVIEDFAAATMTLNGAINTMQRRGVGSVIQYVGHKIFDEETGEPITQEGPNKADDSDFCAAIAP
jgi:predicted small secreted protein